MALWPWALGTRDACLGGLWWLVDFSRELLHAGSHIDDVGVEQPADDRWEETRHVEGEVGTGTRLMVLGEEDDGYCKQTRSERRRRQG